MSKELFTIGITSMPGYIIPLFYESNSRLLENLGYQDRYRLIFFQKGSGVIQVNQNKITFIAPALLFLTENEKIESFKAQGESVSTLYFHPSVINDIFSFKMINNSESNYSQTQRQDRFCISSFLDCIDQRSTLQLGPHNELRVKELFECIAEIIKDPVHDYWPCLSRSYFIELLNYIQRLHILVDAPTIVSSDSEIEEVLLFLNSNYQERITISDIVNRFCTNRTTLSKRFHAVTGSTIIEYLNKIRIHVAQLLLRDTTIPIGEIVYRVGFNDSAHFGKTFRSIANTAPSEYRKKYSIML